MTRTQHLPTTLPYENDMKEIKIHICVVLDTCGPENGEIEIRNEFPGRHICKQSLSISSTTFLKYYSTVHEQSNLVNGIQLQPRMTHQDKIEKLKYHLYLLNILPSPSSPDLLPQCEKIRVFHLFSENYELTLVLDCSNKVAWPKNLYDNFDFLDMNCTLRWLKNKSSQNNYNLCLTSSKVNDAESRLRPLGAFIYPSCGYSQGNQDQKL